MSPWSTVIARTGNGSLAGPIRSVRDLTLEIHAHVVPGVAAAAAPPRQSSPEQP